MTYYRIIATVQDRDTDAVEDRTFTVPVPWGGWLPAWRREHGHRWTMVEVLSAEQIEAIEAAEALA